MMLSYLTTSSGTYSVLQLHINKSNNITAIPISSSLKQIPTFRNVFHDRRNTIFKVTDSVSHETHGSLIVHIRHISRRHTHLFANKTDVSHRIVLARWRPPTDKVTNRPALMPLSVVLQGSYQRTIAPFLAYELKELLVGLYLPKPLPFVLCFPDVPRIVVPDSSWFHVQLY